MESRGYRERGYRGSEDIEGARIYIARAIGSEGEAFCMRGESCRSAA